MSHESSHEAPTMNFDQLGNIARMVAILGLLACIAGFATNREAFFQSYLFSFVFWGSLTLGCLGLTIFHHVIRGSWGLSSLRLWEAGGGVASLGLMGVLFIPILIGMPTLYHHWLHPEPGDAVLAHKAAYLNTPFFIIRLVIYLLIWGVLAYLLRRSSVAQDSSQNPNETAYRTNISAPGLVLFVLTMSFAITDWVMSLDPHWFSSIFGGWYVVGSGLIGLAFGTFVVTANRASKPYSEFVTPKLTKDLGNMLFAFTMLWAYFTLSQFLIIWSGNLPEFTTYYANRREGFWNILGAFNVLFQFFLPFMLLLSPRVKANPVTLMRVAGLIFGMRILDIYWNVMPMMRTSFHWTDLASLIFVGAAWFSVFAAQAKKASLYPAHDNRLIEAAHQHA